MRTWTDTSDEPEIPLAGGDVTEGLVRVGDTVRRRRPINPSSSGTRTSRPRTWCSATVRPSR